ncbi:MAG: type VI secretion system baseplate subunit TssE [Pseudomonadota bacterium]
MKQDDQVIRASILDRLVDREPGVSHEPVQFRFFSLGQIKASVARDLENLLNTKRHILVPPAAYKEVHNSVFVYGLRDFTSLNPKALSVRQELRQDIERTIARFEPRLKNVLVRLESPSHNDRNLRFRISGLLVAEPFMESVTFDTYFDVNRGEYVISK